MRIAIVGGGPGGLFTAHWIDEYADEAPVIDLYEASSRVGGKILTERFEQGASFEAGAAEFYDYSVIDDDPLRQLISSLDLETRDMSGPGVVLGDIVLSTFSDLNRVCGHQPAEAAKAFYDKCADILSPEDFYGDEPDEDNVHPLSQMTMRSLLDEIEDDTARRYIEAAIHSDLATEPHTTTALYGIKNVLLDDPRYARYYCIAGGNERLVTALVQSTAANINLLSTVTAIEQRVDKRLTLTIRTPTGSERIDYDAVVVALPNYWLSGIDWVGVDLRRAVKRHEAHFDQPAHYLRVTVLFRTPFWRQTIRGSWFMHDAFGGCCVYDESSRLPTSDGTAVLSWLIAGSNALALAMSDDQTLIDRVVASLPASMAAGREAVLSGRVHRWIGSVSALPGGKFAMSMEQRHRPSPQQHPNLFMVGDYLHDTTLNGAFDAAEFVADMICVGAADEDGQPKSSSHE